ncbi:hypothetical protein MITS9509_01918 [Synechococcus sp. MIT S9509]|uniref:hypothetical protein n=1 Tax=Synechococcus sp. MIT S9504 TaxID=1801628 RepID=UPI0007BB7093|nr:MULTISPECIES: hypothetical protein [unclassified Synechococcus]KZR85934.1 hypothetical protein MITS9504_01717 [Synechococcus sp. MIT S9504]KZR91997.1 hypothetical protein MITS9509_01918 [Synechococcus sp. MIT S9509]
MNPSSIRRFIFTLITGYLAIFGVQKIPYELDNQWLVLIPVLIVVYIITIWLDGIFFKDSAVEATTESRTKKVQKQSSNKGFGQ